ncbi:MAG: hypothetical protein P8M78_08760 [Myxococcota bacterium]|nr:hypothetical protein [Myxococcota bacterium]
MTRVWLWVSLLILMSSGAVQAALHQMNDETIVDPIQNKDRVDLSHPNLTQAGLMWTHLNHGNLSGSPVFNAKLEAAWLYPPVWMGPSVGPLPAGPETSARAMPWAKAATRVALATWLHNEARAKR